jgi:DNA-binding LytR/AlgR family response regulator
LLQDQHFQLLGFWFGEPIEVLFSDIDLGRGINGFALATWVRSNYPTVRIVLASGVTRMAREAAHLCEAPFLDKPYSYEALADHINGCWRDLKGAAAS